MLCVGYSKYAMISKVILPFPGPAIVTYTIWTKLNKLFKMFNLEHFAQPLFKNSIACLQIKQFI